MAETTKIEWTDATVNFWWGCTKVGPGCDHCYAETWSARFGGEHWGLGAPRRKIKGAAAMLNRLDNDYADWAADAECANGNAKAFGLPDPRIPLSRRVFIQSMSDLFDTEVPLEWFAEAWAKIVQCNRLDIQIVTKRISVVEKRLAAIGVTTWPKHAGLLVTVCNQDEADRDIPRLLALKAKHGIPWVGVSAEPLLGPIDFRSNLGGTLWMGGQRGCDGTHRHDGRAGEVIHGILHESDPRLPHHHHDDRCAAGLDWIIVGGESGPNARPMHPDWARAIRDQCAAAGTAFFFKQWGTWAPLVDRERDDPDWRKDYSYRFADNDQTRWLNLAGGRGFHGERFHVMGRTGKAKASRLLDGATHDGFPSCAGLSRASTPADAEASHG
ncbi:protein gp37 [Bosea sp. OAE506]|uniref:DUF5131 family protein n=1 Tax=Bosea sp. OAE506 TaxID=2663870 RepID=UPI001789F8C4